ncbi:hypothetical protein Pan258_57350 [Symmachiella dynata]|uniref:Uncharacterized protein n=1 Tax=Symmachiella dynata TaxID=2527995 RepID=A0A517ZXY3_9PLAN|nr:hypothetical protein Pan258_57350 [Symmachiella dynata]QDU47343.1 hypothetical protein Mal52_58720 [Symmachiella dynata]
MSYKDRNQRQIRFQFVSCLGDARTTQSAPLEGIATDDLIKDDCVSVLVQRLFL